MVHEEVAVDNVVVAVVVGFVHVFVEGCFYP
jgi:hypothetical protein